MSLYDQIDQAYARFKASPTDQNATEVERLRNRATAQAYYGDPDAVLPAELRATLPDRRTIPRKMLNKALAGGEDASDG